MYRPNPPISSASKYCRGGIEFRLEKKSKKVENAKRAQGTGLLMASDLMAATPDAQSWRWVLESFRSARAPEFPCQLNLCDTVLLDRGRAVAWLFTSKAGVVLRKSEQKLTWPNIQKGLKRTALSFRRNAAGPQCAAVLHAERYVYPAGPTQ